MDRPPKHGRSKWTTVVTKTKWLMSQMLLNKVIDSLMCALRNERRVLNVGVLSTKGFGLRTMPKTTENRLSTEVSALYIEEQATSQMI